MTRATAENILRVVLVILITMFFAFVILPDAKGSPPPQSRVVLEIEDEKLRVFELHSQWATCYVAIIDVKMIGAQASISCVRNMEEAYVGEIQLFKTERLHEQSP